MAEENETKWMKNKGYKKKNGRPTSIKTHIKRMRLAAENDDAEGMLENLRLAAIKAFEESEDPFNRMTPRFILEIVNAELQLLRMRLKYQAAEGGTEEDLNDFLERLQQEQAEGKTEGEEE